MTRARGARGQALAETGIVIVMVVTLLCGIIEFGRAFLITNLVTHAARDGARMAAVVPATQRSAAGMILDTSGIVSQVKAQLQGPVDPAALTVAVAQGTTSGIPTVTLTVSGTVPYIFNLPGIGRTFAVARTMTFRDEGR